MFKVKGIIAAIILGMVISGFALSVSAQPGLGKQASCLAVLNGTPVTLEGSVYSCINGQGMKVDSGGDMVTVFGLGPVRFWQNSGVSRPVTGDSVTIDGRQVEYSNGDQRIVIMSMTVNGIAITLRDEKTGCPVWQGKGKGRNRN